MDTPPRAAGNGLAPLAARASDSGFPSGPFPLSGCFALNSQSSAFPSPPFPPLPPFQSGAGRIPDISGPARAPPPLSLELPTEKGSPVQRPGPPPAAQGWERSAPVLLQGGRGGAGSPSGCRLPSQAPTRGRPAPPPAGEGKKTRPQHRQFIESWLGAWSIISRSRALRGARATTREGPGPSGKPTRGRDRGRHKTKLVPRLRGPAGCCGARAGRALGALRGRRTQREEFLPAGGDGFQGAQ